MNYSTGYALNARELMKNFPTRKLEMSTKVCTDLIGNRHKEYAAEEIWKALIGLMLDDVINNSDTFVLPTKSRKAEIYMKSYEDEDFKKGRRNGKWEDVDFLESNFTGAQMMLKLQRGGYLFEKPIYVDNVHKNKITERLNSGKSYY